MSKFFMYGTSLEGIEQLMMMAPNFIPRGSGIVINNYFNCEGGVVDCNRSTSSVRERSNTNMYINLKEKLKGDEIKYSDLVKDSFGKLNNNALRSRLKLLSSKFKGEMFLNNSHKERFYNVLQKQEMDLIDKSPKYLAILFLLTSDEILWELSEDAANLNGFDFNKIRLRQISTDSYALYQTAKTISTGKEYIKISEIADEDLIEDTSCICQPKTVPYFNRKLYHLA